MTIEAFLAQLDGVRSRGTGKFSARCPAHDDQTPSLSIAEGASGRILLHDFGGCLPGNIVAAMNLELKDLFTDAPTPHLRRAASKPMKLDRVALAFRFEMAALDRRLRAERVREAGKKLDIAALSDAELDRAFAFAAQAHADLQRAELLEGLADDLRMKYFLERHHEHKRRVA